MSARLLPHGEENDMRISVRKAFASVVVLCGLLAFVNLRLASWHEDGGMVDLFCRVASTCSANFAIQAMTLSIWSSRGMLCVSQRIISGAMFSCV